MNITAYAAFSADTPLQKFTYQKELQSTDVLVKVKYCSVTRGDIRFIDNFWHDTQYPLIPGLEIIGVIEECGEDVQDLQLGDIVGIGYQVGACFTCEYCLAGKEQFCLKQKLIPINDYGGLAEHIIVDYRFVFKMPENIQSAESTPLLCSGLTTYSAIKKCKVQEKMNVGVVGIGSLGHLAIQFLQQMGCDVDAFTHTNEKFDILKQLEVQRVIPSNDTNELQKYEREYDFILSTSSANLPWETYIKMLKPEGIFCIVGLPSEPISFDAEILADFAQRTIVGSYIGSRKEMAEMLAFASQHTIKAQTQVFDIVEVNEVLDKIRNNEIHFSAVLQNEHSDLSSQTKIII